MRKFKLLIEICFLAICASNLSAEINFSGSVKTEAAMTFWWTKEPGKFVVAETDVNGKLKYYGDKTALVVDGMVSYNPVKYNFIDYSVGYDFGSNAFKFKLNEAYFDYNGGFWSFRIGRQLATWGAGDKFVAVNILCPVDETMLASQKVSEKMIGIDAVKLSFNNDVLLFDFYWIPFFTPSVLPVDGKFIRPELSLWNGEAAARLSAYFGFADFSLYGFYGFEDSPSLKYDFNGTSFELRGGYERVTMIGFDSSVPIGEMTVRFEAAFYPERSFSNMISIEKHNNLIGIIGFDWMKGDFTLSGQYFADYVFGDVEKLERKNFDHKASLMLKYSITDINLDLSLNGIINLNDLDSVIAAGAEYSITDELKLSLEGFFLIPGTEREGEYGKLKDFSCFKLGAKYSF